MKKQSLCYTILHLFIFAVLAQSCQKAPSKKISTPAADTVLATEKLVTLVCSADLISKRKTFQLVELQTLALHDKMSLHYNSEHTQNYRRIAQKQVESCTAILDQFEQEKISVCFKTADDKSQENLFQKEILEKKCIALGDWGKTVTRAENTFTEVTKPKVITVKLGSNAQKLIQSKSVSEFLYLLKSEIKSDKDQYQKDAQAGQTTCTLSSQSNEVIAAASILKYVTESVANKADVGFELKGKSSLITFQDGNSNVVSLLCLNLETSSEKERANSLKKIFGHQALIQEYEKDDAQLNADLALPAVKSDDKAETTEKAVAEAEKNKAIDQTIDKARSTIQGVLKETLEEIKKVSLEISEGSIARAQQASATVVIKAEAAGINIVKAGETAGSNLLKASETTGGNLIVAAEVSAMRVANYAAETLATTAANVSEKTIAQSTVAGKELIKEGKVAAIEVANHTINQAKTTAVDTLKAPFKWIGEKATNLWDGFAGFFSSSNKKNATVDIRKKIRK